MVRPSTRPGVGVHGIVVAALRKKVGSRFITRRLPVVFRIHAEANASDILPSPPALPRRQPDPSQHNPSTQHPPRVADTRRRETSRPDKAPVPAPEIQATVGPDWRVTAGRCLSMRSHRRRRESAERPGWRRGMSTSKSKRGRNVEVRLMQKWAGLPRCGYAEATQGPLHRSRTRHSTAFVSFA